MSSWLNNTSNWIKKQYFNSAHYLQILTNQGQKLIEEQQDIYLFGIKFDKDHRHQAFQVYQSIIWFTYRQNIQFQNLQQGKAKVTSDVGWGCMLRVGQMMLAQTLRLQKGREYYSDVKYLNQIIGQFINQNGWYSIQRLAKIGKKYINKTAGQWYSSYDIALVLKKATQQKQQFFQQQKSNLKSPAFSCQSLQIIITTSQFSLKQTYNKTKITSKQNKTLYKTKPCLLIVICRIGYLKAEQNLLHLLIQLIKYQKNCVGILGGRPGKAHYIFGTTQKSFIYLDPHCVKNQLNIQSFLCETLFSMAHEKIDPSLGICFYLDNFKQMMLMHQRLRKMNVHQLIYCHEFQMFDFMSFQFSDSREEEQVFQILE